MDTQQMFLTSLQLLGFDASAMERKWRTPFNKDMFKLQNKKGFEVIMYFLFDKMNPTQCREEFRNCWPVQDKKQEQEFRRVVNRWLTDIAKDTESHLPRFASSLFLSPSGDKLYQLFTAFSRYIMVKQITASGYKQRNFLNYPVLTPQNQTMGSVLVKTIKCGTIRHHRQALEHITQSVAVQEEWKQMASEQVKRYRGLSKSIRELEREKEVQLQKLLKRRPESDSLLEYDLEVENVRRAQKIQEVRDLWRQLDGCSRCSDRSTMEASLEAAHDTCVINAAELAVKVPDVLLRECEQEIQRRGVENIYEGGKLNLLSLLHLWNLSLHLLLEKLHKVGVPDFREDIPVISSQVHTHNAHLANLQSLRLKLEHEILPELKEKTAKLKRELDQIVFSSMSPNSVRMTSLGFGLMPPTPPVNFDPSDSKTPSNMAVNMMTAQQHAQPEHTPEAAMQIMESINKRAAGSGKHSSASFLIQGTPTGIPKKKKVPTATLR